MLVSSAKVNGVILPIIAFSIPLAEALAIIGVPQGFVGCADLVSERILGADPDDGADPVAAGCVMETTPNIVILAPILFPLAQEIEMNEIQFCIMMITALGVGFITPPWGSTSSWCRGSRRVDPQDRLPRDPVRLLHADRDADDRLHPGLLHILLPDVYR
jgi:di/tricarboxylate transporter